MTHTKYPITGIAEELDISPIYIYEIKKRLGIKTGSIKTKEDRDQIVEAVKKIRIMWKHVTIPTIKRFFEKVHMNDEYERFFRNRMGRYTDVEE